MEIMSPQMNLSAFAAGRIVGGMNFPQFWAYGKAGKFSTWRWSTKSVADAQDLAMKAAMTLAERFRNGMEVPFREGRYYPNYPMREQILQEFKDLSGQTTA